MSEARIAVDARPLCYPGTGIGRYTHELLYRLCRMGGQWFLYAHQHYDRGPFDLPNVHHRSAGLPAAMRGSQLGQLLFPYWARRDRVQALWGPRHQLPPMLSAGIRTVLTMHDLVWKEYGDTMRFPGRQVEDFMTPRALARADVIAVVSQFTQQRLKHYFPQYAHKVTVVPGASMLEMTNSRDLFTPLPQQEKYLLFVGTLEPRKNLGRLLRAYKRYLSSASQARRLKIVGGDGWGGESIEGLLSELSLTNEVELLGKVDEKALRNLYLGAYALLMPSLYEGFGLPVVEALSVGVPVITSRNSAMSEVAGGSGLYVDPYSEDEIWQALMTICENHGQYASLVQRSFGEAGRYSWGSSAATMADLLFR